MLLANELPLIFVAKSKIIPFEKITAKRQEQ